MFGRASLLATVLLAPVITAAPAVSALAGTCNAVSVAPCVTKLRAYTSGSAFCTTWLSISTQTATASTTSVTTNIATEASTSTTGTTTIPAAETVTVLDHGVSVIGHAVSETVIAHATTEWAPTPTVVAHVSFTTITTTLTSTICGNAKRAAATNIPSVLQSFKSSIISSACSCLPLTTPSTTVTTTASSTALTTTTETQNVLATETTTNTVTSTWYTTSIPTLTTIVTPTTTLTPAPVTSTPVSTATVTETKTVHVGQAAVQLTNPTPIITAASRSYDDNTGLRINNIPFDVGLYGVTSRTLIIGINGWVSPGTTDSGTYVNQPLPNAAAGDPSWVAYWADLYVTQGTTQGIYYQIDGDEGSRTLSIEYFMSFFGASSAYTHFMVTLFEEEVGRVVLSYFQTTSTKASTNSAYGTIGVQRPATGQYNQYSYNVQPQEGLTIEWRPSTNQWTQVSSGTC